MFVVSDSNIHVLILVKDNNHKTQKVLFCMITEREEEKKNPRDCNIENKNGTNNLGMSELISL